MLAKCSGQPWERTNLAIYTTMEYRLGMQSNAACSKFSNHNANSRAVGCACADSSEALMAGRKPLMSLFIRAVSSEGEPIATIPSLVSEGFVVSCC